MKKPFEEIVTAHGATVLRVTRAMLRQHDAEDAWSETFLAALKAYPALAVDANVQAWLVTIAHRKALDILRAQSKRPITVDELPERPSTLGLPGLGDDELRAALEALPEKQRHAVVYHYLAGLPHKNIAEILGGTTDAARRAAADGINTLRRTYPNTPALKGETR